MSAIRIITEADIPGAMHLKDTARWNQTAADWRNVFQLAPQGCFGIDIDGELAATATAVCFGRELAWIGMVLTHPDHRGKGLARKLMEDALAYLDGRVDCVKLDATDMGRPLYAKLGFEDECAVERWARPGKPGFSLRGTSASLSKHAGEVDRKAFGADWGELLSVLAQIECNVTDAGYAMGRPGSGATYFGPCVAQTGEAAKDLVDGFLAKHTDEAIYWDLLPDNQAAARIAGERGFQPLRKLVRMARPGKPALAHDDSMVYAIAGFEYG